MTHRDRLWRGLGVALVVVASAVRMTEGFETQIGAGLAAFILMLAGLVLIVQGKRVPAALRIERSRHRLLAQAIRDRRHRRPGDGDA
ncbi:hypothetical protein [Sphingomonas glacialis]|uniref:Uncharacterized protein n=1 Tax=Sphingomonas glacialis TaxID=658225 RepID=A0A502FZB7_9SPHN|nr:hypothetical protein [Sphingomonas glacialis]TPG54223.1 hypothetical protein EAH76_05920 [Sphingomonas glacialis]